MPLICRMRLQMDWLSAISPPLTGNGSAAPDLSGNGIDPDNFARARADHSGDVDPVAHQLLPASRAILVGPVLEGEVVGCIGRQAS